MKRTFRNPLKSSVIFAALAVVLALPWLSSGSAVFAATLEWDRNTEPDMQSYRVYLCLTAGCTVTKSGTPTATVPHPPLGVVPSWDLPSGVLGSAVVTAVDTAGNESPESNLVSFDTQAPDSPSHARVR